MIITDIASLKIGGRVGGVGRTNPSYGSISGSIFYLLIDPLLILGGIEIAVHPVGGVEIIFEERGVDFTALGIYCIHHGLQVALLVLDLGLNFNCNFTFFAFLGLVGDFIQGLVHGY